MSAIPSYMIPAMNGSQSAPPSYQQSLQALQSVYGNLYGNAYQSYKNAQSQGLAGMMGAGLGATTLYPGVRQGFYRQYQQTIDSLAAQQGQAQAQLGMQYNQLDLQKQNTAQGWQALDNQQSAQNQRYALDQQALQAQTAAQQVQQQPTDNYYPGSYLSPEQLSNFSNNGMFQNGGGMFG